MTIPHRQLGRGPALTSLCRMVKAEGRSRLQICNDYKIAFDRVHTVASLGYFRRYLDSKTVRSPFHALREGRISVLMSAARTCEDSPRIGEAKLLLYADRCRYSTDHCASLTPFDTVSLANDCGKLPKAARLR